MQIRAGWRGWFRDLARAQQLTGSVLAARGGVTVQRNGNVCDARGSGSIQGRNGSIEIALPEVERDFVERTLLPLFGFREPENPTLGIK
jgi:hypothetical protein